MQYDKTGVIWILVVFSFVCVLMGAIGFVFVTAWGDNAFAALSTQADADLADAQAKMVVAEAEHTQAEAALTQAQANRDQATANLEREKGDRQLKEKQGEALIIGANASHKTVQTSNRLMTVWGMTFPMLPPFYIGIGVLVGGLAGASAGYTLGRFQRDKTSVSLVPSTPSPSIPDPEVIGV